MTVLDTLNNRSTEQPLTAAPGHMETEVRLGMPMLSMSGLSENWLLKTCGDLHWQAICTAMGRPSHAITDARGNRLYASFITLCHRGADLSAFQENDHITITTQVRAVSKRRIWSHHRIANNQTGAIKELEMLSLFIKRGTGKKANSQISSGEPLSTLRLPPYNRDHDRAAILEPGHRQAPITPTRNQTDLGHSYGGSNSVEDRPCPATEFNGAKLLYFASFQSILDRAEWQHFADWPIENMTCQNRTIRYFGNADPRDTIVVSFLDIAISQANLYHRAILTRRSDGKVIAEIETQKVTSRPAD